MSSKILAVLLVAFSGVLVQAAPNTGLVFLGKSETRASLYFRSMDTIAWTGVSDACIGFLGATATPLYMEQIAELDEVRTFLANTESNTQYWIGGEWDDNDKHFQWANEVPMGSEWDSSWDTGHPNSMTPVTKIMLFKQDILNVKLRTTFLSENHYFICELPL